jgi:peptidoglycan hydrolase CwlO-like protein
MSAALGKANKRKEKLKKHKKLVAEYKEKMAKLTEDMQRLRSDSANNAPEAVAHNAAEQRTHDENAKALTELQAEVAKLRKTIGEQKAKLDTADRSILDANHELRKAQDKLKETNEEFGLKLLEEKEQLSKKVLARRHG